MYVNKYIYTHKWNIIQPFKKEGNPAIFDMDETKEHYAVQNKTQKEKYYKILLICEI